MKAISKYLWAILAFAALSCSEQAKEEDYFIVEGLQDSYEFLGSVSCSEQFHINSSSAWKIETESSDWMNISPVRQEGGQNTVTISVQETTSSNPRTGTFTLVCGDLRRTVKVTQLGIAPSIVFSALSGNYNFSGGKEDGTSDLTLTANGSWSVASKPEWVNLSVTSGESGTSTIEVTADQIQSESSRTGIVSFLLGEQTFEYVVKQNGKPSAYLYVDRDMLSLAIDGTASEPGANAIRITCNKEWTLTCDEWISASATSGSDDAVITVSAASNAGSAPREGTILLSTADGNASASVAVYQDGVAAGFIDLSSALVWDVSTNETLVDYSPEWKTGGIMRPSTFSDLARAEWVRTPANTNDLTYTFQSSYPGYQVKGGVWDNDGVYFHIPVSSLPAGKTLKLYFSLRMSGTNGQYWKADISLDDGATWTMMDTGETYKTGVLGADANVKLDAKGTVFYFVASYKIDATVKNRNIQLRIICPDGADQFNGVASGPSTSATAVLTKYVSEDLTFNGPAVVLE